MKTIHVNESVGTVLCQDITRIVPGQTKGPAFRRGHIITEADIPVLLDIGKEHLYVYEPSEGIVHEDDAAKRIANAAAGKGLELTSPVEGKVTFKAAYDGLVEINTDLLFELNSLPDVIFGSVHTNQLVKKGRGLGGTRVIPLVVKNELVSTAEKLLQDQAPLIQVHPLRHHKIGLIITGSEVYQGRIKDKFGPVIREKFAEYGSTIIGQRLFSDSQEMTVSAIHDFQKQGADFIVLTGGMSVDPDDQTPASIRASGANVVTYGAPTFPGAMFMLANLGNIPVIGLPGCVMYYRASIFDLVVPRLLAGIPVTKADIIKLGHGGYCESCSECRYPVCGFGKGA